jgi:hypothetical protein
VKKSELRDKLRQVKIYNDYEFFADQPHIVRSPASNWNSPQWAVHKRGAKLSEHYMDGGGKVFYIHGRKDITAARLRAQEWASEKFGIDEWAIGPFGAYGPKKFIEKRIKYLLKALD